MAGAGGTQYYKTLLTAANYEFVVDVRYQNLRPIGAGSYGIVCSADDTTTGTKVAIKKVGDTFADLVDAKRILRELKLLRHFGGHENVIRILDIMTFPAGTINFDDIYIVTELMESDLDRIISSSQPLTDAHYQYFLYQVLRGMKFIHSANVLHRDLKPSNLLVNANCDLAICDFGLARGVELESDDPMTEYVVTRWYRSPELLCDNQNYGPGVDTWAAGCIFAEMLTRRAFFQGADPRSQLETIVRKLGSPTEAELEFVDSPDVRDVLRSFPPSPRVSLFEYFPDCNPDAVDLLERMLCFSDRDRISVDEALQHPYLSLLHDQSDEPVSAEVFNFEFERNSLTTGDDIPKEELQALMFSEMLHFRAASLSPGPLHVPSPRAAPSPIRFPGEDEEFEDVSDEGATPRRRHGFN